jgi:hypothetical protein
VSRAKSRELLKQIKARMKAEVEQEVFLDENEFQVLESKPFGEDGPRVLKIMNKSAGEAK